MGIRTHLSEFGGLPVRAWLPGEPLPDPANSAVRLMLTWEQEQQRLRWLDLLAGLLATPGSDQLAGLVVGAGEWMGRFDHNPGSADEMVEALVAARRQLPNLRMLFIGDLTSEECEISWIAHPELLPLLTAYPNLEIFGVRGTANLVLTGLRHAHLRQLTIQSGGLDRRIVADVLSADLPMLEHLELWIGMDGYGRTTELQDLQPLLRPTPPAAPLRSMLGRLLGRADEAAHPFPKLRHLGLRDAEIADQIAAAVATSAILDQLEVLDLSLGTLSDNGAEALLASPKLRSLKKLDIHYHYCSDAMIARLQQLPFEVDTSNQQQADDDDEDGRYVAVGE